MWDKLSIGLALFFIFEGMLPFLSPSFWRNIMLDMANKSDTTIRSIGFCCMLVGLALLFLLP